MDCKNFWRKARWFVILLSIGELACGNLKNRGEILSLLKTIPEVMKADDQEVLRFIEDQKLMGKGLGYIDMHLLASALLSRIGIWTLDRKLQEVAQEFMPTSSTQTS